MEREKLEKILEGVYLHGTKQSTEVIDLEDGEYTIADAANEILKLTK